MTSSGKVSTSGSVGSGGGGSGWRLLLLWAMVALTAAAVSSASAFPFDAAPEVVVKRQIQPPAKPDRFTSMEQFDTYMKQLEAYLKLIGRQRFGKRSEFHRLWRTHQQRWPAYVVVDASGDFVLPSVAAAAPDLE